MADTPMQSILSLPDKKRIIWEHGRDESDRALRKGLNVLAEREGFEPPLPVRINLISSPFPRLFISCGAFL